MQAFFAHENWQKYFYPIFTVSTCKTESESAIKWLTKYVNKQIKKLSKHRFKTKRPGFFFHLAFGKNASGTSPQLNFDLTLQFSVTL